MIYLNFPHHPFPRVEKTIEYCRWAFMTNVLTDQSLLYLLCSFFIFKWGIPSTYSHKQVIGFPFIVEIHHINAYYSIKKGTEMHVLWRVKKQFADLVAENDVSHTKVDQEKWQYQRREDEVCHTKKTKETNPGNFTMVRYWRGIKIIITISTKSSAHKIGNKCSQLKQFWCYSGPSRSYNICYEEGCLHQIYKILKN